MLRYANRVLKDRNMSFYMFLPILSREFIIDTADIVKNTYSSFEGELGFFILFIKSTSFKYLATIKRIEDKEFGQLLKEDDTYAIYQMNVPSKAKTTYDLCMNGLYSDIAMFDKLLILNSARRQSNEIHGLINSVVQNSDMMRAMIELYIGRTLPKEENICMKMQNDYEELTESLINFIIDKNGK